MTLVILVVNTSNVLTNVSAFGQAFHDIFVVHVTLNLDRHCVGTSPILHRLLPAKDQEACAVTSSWQSVRVRCECARVRLQ